MKNKKMVIYLIIMSILFSFNSCSQKNTSSKLPASSLSPLEITGNYITPEGGVNIADAKAIILQYLKDIGIVGNFEGSLTIEEITTKEAWDNNKIQIYKTGFNFESGVTIIKGGKAVSYRLGKPTNNIFLADLDIDGIYEVYQNITYDGYAEILGYNAVTKEFYYLSKRTVQKDIALYIENSLLYAKVIPSMTSTVEKKARVYLKKSADNTTILEIE